MNWEYVSVDTDSLEAGKFYLILTNKDNATLTIYKPTDASIIFSSDFSPEDFIVDNGMVRLNPNVIKQTEFDPAQFVVGLDGMVHLKSGGSSPNGEGVTINFSPVITNTQTCDDDECNKECPVTSVRTHTVNGATIVPIQASVADVININYKLKSSTYMETGTVTITTLPTDRAHANRITGYDPRSIAYTAVRNNGAIALEITPPVGEAYTFSYIVTTI